MRSTFLGVVRLIRLQNSRGLVHFFGSVEEYCVLFGEINNLFLLKYMQRFERYLA